jgi:hypothetical protein
MALEFRHFLGTHFSPRQKLQSHPAGRPSPRW